MIVKTSQDEIQNYLVDAANVKGFCEAVYIPESTDDIKAIIKVKGCSLLEKTFDNSCTSFSTSKPA